MKEIKKIFCLFLAITLLSGSVLANETAYTPGYMFSIRGTDVNTEERNVNIGDKINIVKIIAPGISTAKINDSKETYYLNNQGLIPFDKAKEYKEYLSENRGLTKIKAKRKYNFNSYIEKNIEMLNMYTKDFVMSGKNDKEKLINILNYVNDKNLIYDKKDYNLEAYNHNNKQVTTLTQGMTKCNGVTMLASYLMDKSNIEYRLVCAFDYNISKEEFASGPCHIYNEVKLDNTWYKVDFTKILSDRGAIAKPYYKINENFFNASFGLEEDVPSFEHALNKNYPNKYFKVSKIFNPKEKLENNCSYDYIWSGKTIYDNFKNFVQENQLNPSLYN